MVLGASDVRKRQVALKRTDKSRLEALEKARQEARTLRELLHPNIVSLTEEFEDDSHHFMALEMACDGDLLHWMRARAPNGMPESEARRVFFQIVSAVEYAHASGYVHRDIKLENVLLFDGVDCVKLADWGLATRWYPDAWIREPYGSPMYAAPEIWDDIVFYRGPEVDCWSLGVVLYALLTGWMPFSADDESELSRRIRSAAYSPLPSSLSDEAADLVARLLTVDSSWRARIRDVVHHPWLRPDSITTQARRASAPTVVCAHSAGAVVGSFERRSLLLDGRLRRRRSVVLAADTEVVRSASAAPTSSES